jgi:glutathione S-transferase
VKLYDAARCPYCARVRLALAERGRAYEMELYRVVLPERLASWLNTLCERPAVALELELVRGFA